VGRRSLLAGSDLRARGPRLLAAAPQSVHLVGEPEHRLAVGLNRYRERGECLLKRQLLGAPGGDSASSGRSGQRAARPPKSVRVLDEVSYREPRTAPYSSGADSSFGSIVLMPVSHPHHIHLTLGPAMTLPLPEDTVVILWRRRRPRHLSLRQSRSSYQVSTPRMTRRRRLAVPHACHKRLRTRPHNHAGSEAVGTRKPAWLHPIVVVRRRVSRRSARLCKPEVAGSSPARSITDCARLRRSADLGRTVDCANRAGARGDDEPAGVGDNVRHRVCVL
jgi:hypothetical protein